MPIVIFPCLPARRLPLPDLNLLPCSLLYLPVPALSSLSYASIHSIMPSRQCTVLSSKLLEWTSSNSFRVAGPHLQALLNYVSTLKVDSDLAVRVYGKLGAVEGCCDGFHFSVETVDGALLELGELFRVPKLHHLKDNNTLMPSQLVTGFIIFLLQFLDLHPLSSVSSEFKVVKYYLVPELKFLVTILGDAPFEAAEHEQVQSILAGFEQVANEAGLLLHSLIFSPNHQTIASQKEMRRRIKMKKIEPFLEHINLLSSNIVKFLNSLPSIISFPQRNDTRDSLFVVRNLICDLMDRVTRTGNDSYDTTSDDNEDVEEEEDIEKPWDLIEIVDRKVIEDVEDIEDLRMLYVRLRFLLPFLKGANVPQHLETEFNQLLRQIRDKGCEAEYLIKRDLPLWYRTIRLIHVAGSLAVIGSRLQEMKTTYDSGVLNVVDHASKKTSSSTPDTALPLWPWQEAAPNCFNLNDSGIPVKSAVCSHL